MSYERKRLMTLGAVVLTAMLVSAPTGAFAQRNKSAGGVTGGARTWPVSGAQQRASRSVQHARDYSRDIYQYSRVPTMIQPSVAKTESEELGRNIAKAQQEFAVVRQEVGSDPATAATLKTIDQHLAAAEKQHAMLHAECCKESVDGTACMKHCNQILLDLDKAQAEHDAMMRSMEIKEQTPE